MLSPADSNISATITSIIEAIHLEASFSTPSLVLFLKRASIELTGNVRFF